MRFAVFGIVRGIKGQKNNILLISEVRSGVYGDESSLCFWKLPGGKSKNEEYPGLTLVRELFEEININIERPLDKDVIFKKEESGHIFLVYNARYYNGELGKGKEIKEIKFFSPREVERMILCNKILPKHATALLFHLGLIKPVKQPAQG